MPKFILHEPLAMDLFNLNHNTAQGTLQPWGRFLTNNTELLELILERMESDYTALSCKMRKPYGAKEVET
jgi:hypothetical protein